MVCAVLAMAENDRDQRSPSPPRAETGSLAERIGKARKDRADSEAARDMREQERSGWGRAFRLASEIVAAVIVGGVIGLALDAVFGTRPILLIAMVLVGFAAGILNVVRAAAEMNAQAPQPDPSQLAPVDDEDEEDRG